MTWIKYKSMSDIDWPKIRKREGETVATINWSESPVKLYRESPAKKAWKTRMEKKRKKDQDDGLIPRTVEEDVHNAVKDALKILRG